MGALRNRMRAALGLLALVAAVAGCGGAHARGATAGRTTTEHAAAPSGALTVESTPTTTALPAGFLGMSVELTVLSKYAGTDPRAVNPVFLALLRNLAPGQQPVLRLGGDSTDWTWWPVAGMARPGGIRLTLTPQYLAVVQQLAKQLDGKLIVGVNLEAGSVRLAQTEARQIVDRVGRRYLAGLEIGNEPELYSAFNWYETASGGVKGRPRDWTEQDYFDQFGQFADAMPSAVPIAGPASGGPAWLADLGGFLKAQPKVRIATVHAYPLKHCTASKVLTIPQLLAGSSIAGFAQSLAPYIAAAHSNGRQLRIDEMNGITCGGFKGVSNSFASALWVLDTLFELERAGVDGVNIQTVPGSDQQVLGPADGDAMAVDPEYYGMLMFAQASPAGSQLLKLSASTPPGVTVWATRADDGAVHVVAINTRLARAQTVRLRIPSPAGSASVELLRAPHIGSTTGVTLGGRTFGAATSTGTLAAPTPVTLTPTGGVYTVRLPPASATMLTLGSTTSTTAAP